MRLCILFLMISLITFSSEAQKNTTIKINFNEGTDQVQLQINGEAIPIESDMNGKAIFKTKISTPQYVQLLRISKRPELLYIFPDDELEVTIAGKTYGKLEFKGKHAKLNAYLVNSENIKVGGGFNLDEADYINFLRSRVEETIKRMEDQGFEESFTQKEKKRIAVKIYTSMVGYPNIKRRTDRNFQASDTFYKYVNSQLFEDEKMLSIKEYTDFIEYMFRMLATKDLENYNAFDYSNETLNYVIANVKNKKIKTHLINFYAYDYLKRNGILEAEPITKIFKQYVKDSEKRKIYDETWETWARITPGRLMPELNFTDINGQSVSLTSLRGKYIYIDVWATWCKPCIAEIPNLKKMEHRLADKNIVFLSISVDKDRDAWVKMVKEDNFTGMQWHSPSREFSEELMIVSIPRFILIDPQGKIVEANVSRPDRDETYKLFETLAGL